MRRSCWRCVCALSEESGSSSCGDNMLAFWVAVTDSLRFKDSPLSSDDARFQLTSSWSKLFPESILAFILFNTAIRLLYSTAIESFWRLRGTSVCCRHFPWEPKRRQKKRGKAERLWSLLQVQKQNKKLSKLYLEIFQKCPTKWKKGIKLEDYRREKMKYRKTKSATPVPFESATQLIGALHNKSIMYQSLHACIEVRSARTARTARLICIFKAIVSTASSRLRV